MKPLHLGVLICLASAPVMAQPGQKWQPGFSGDISLLAGFTQTTSQFNTDNQTTSSLLQPGEKKTEALIAPLGSLHYTFDGADKQLFFGTSRSDVALGRFHVELGYRQSLQQNGMLSISYVPGLLSQNTWQDPYIENQPRKETDSSIQGLRFQYEKILGSDFSVEVAAGQQKIDDEKSGQEYFTPQEQALLERESNILYLQGAYRHTISAKRFLRSAVNYTRIDADGKAMASHIYGAEIGLVQLLPSSSFALTLSYDRARFDDDNPVFDQRQMDDRWRAFLAYAYNKPFGWKNWGLVSLIGYSDSNSTISFYDEKSLVMTVGVNYVF
ncbi:DUF2860 domain-containing protein [Photobacterium sp.]|uniref:DUF2860 domain-containing protein n=1 Tax=Photobacterium sp. TaxID=660 RepID=UPI00299D4A09|nr:DUF2860 domain-containing protein [Photobacterium sp.]MDX1301654.1 DUF2860 domain-containing protein [Photobacterium sp.]